MVPKLLGVALNSAYGSWRWQRPRAPLQGFILVLGVALNNAHTPHVGNALEAPSWPKFACVRCLQ